MAGLKKDLEEVKVYAQHFVQPITNISEFNDFLKDCGLRPVKRETVRKLLDY